MDPFITLGTLLTFRMAISKVMISMYIKIVEKYSGATKLKGEQGGLKFKIKGFMQLLASSYCLRVTIDNRSSYRFCDRFIFVDFLLFRSQIIFNKSQPKDDKQPLHNICISGQGLWGRKQILQTSRLVFSQSYRVNLKILKIPIKSVRSKPSIEVILIILYLFIIYCKKSAYQIHTNQDWKNHPRLYLTIQLVNYLITYINIIDTTQSISQNPKQMCQPCCYSYQTRCFTFCHILFGIPLFLIFSIFNVLLIVTALADSFITIGSFAYYHMIVSENLLHFYKQCVSGYSQAIGINGSKGDCAAVHGVCTCFLCWAPVLTSILLSLTLIPIGLVADILLLLFSLFRFRLQVTKTNIFVMIVTCRVYQSLVQSETSDISVRTDIHSNIDSFQDIARHL